MKKLLIVLGFFTGVALYAHYILHAGVIAFITAACASVIISKLMGEAVQQLALYYGQRNAAFISVLFANMSELIFVVMMVFAHEVELLQGSIVGSIIGNLLLVLGGSIVVGCWKNGTIKLNENVTGMYLKQFFLVGSALFMLTILDAHIPAERQQHVSYILALMLIGAYVYFYHIARSDERYEKVREEARSVEKKLSKKQSFGVLILSILAALPVSHTLVAEVQTVSLAIGLPKPLIGFIIMPFLSNISENFTALVAAKKKMALLSMSIALGSPSQVAMVVAPVAILTSYVTGNPITLHFDAVPMALLLLSFGGTFMALYDNKWNKMEGVMLLGVYGFIVLMMFFMR